MKRYTGQQALYEAISRSRAKAKQSSVVERLRPESTNPESPTAQPASLPAEPEQISPPVMQESAAEPQAVVPLSGPAVAQEPVAEPVEKAPESVPQFEPAVVVRPVERVLHPAPPSPVQTWLRPRPVQLNEGRIEISVPYYIGVIAALAVLVVVLAAFRLGQARSNGQATDAARQVQPASNKAGVPAVPPPGTAPRSATTNTDRTPFNSSAPTTAGQDAAAVKPSGDHWLVLAQYKRQEDFEPVKKHFAEHGVKLGVASLADLREFFAANGLNTGVLPSGDGFLLVTADSFENPRVSGTDGYRIKQRITEVGALYRGKAPSGYESFAPNYFSDAYPMKIR